MTVVTPQFEKMFNEELEKYYAESGPEIRDDIEKVYGEKRTFLFWDGVDI